MKKIIILISFLSSGLLLIAEPPSRLYEPISSYQADYATLQRKYKLKNDDYYQRMEKLYQDWQQYLSQLDFESLHQTERIDYILFKNLLEKNSVQNSIEREQYAEISDILNFGKNLVRFIEERRRAADIKPKATADALYQAHLDVQILLNDLKQKERYSSWMQAERASQAVGNFRENLEDALKFYMDYHPEFGWWVEQPWEQLQGRLKQLETSLKEHYNNKEVKDDGSGIIGRPIGSKALALQLKAEFIPYTAEELIRLAHEQFAWCEGEMLKASEKLGYGKNWKAALEYVKELYVETGEQPFLVRDLAEEAIQYIENHDLLSLDDMAKESWRMDMMSPQMQLYAPFFLGGERILIAYPTRDMPHDAKLMSLRGNNPHFTRAVVHHELIPGHHLQQYMNQRHKPYRRVFYTPFWTEGWALYWELNLWDKGFARSTEDEIGMLFWRMHRCARIIFSLSYHLEKMTPKECIDLLVDKVGHERANAEAEVRRSFMGNYGPLYQIAYMVGGLQFYALKKELVDSGEIEEKAFHDAILRMNSIPVEMVRAALTDQNLNEDFRTNWKFIKVLK